MILGNASWGFRQTPLEKQLAVSKELGLELLELGIGGHTNDFLQLNANAVEITQVKQFFAKHKIKLVCASTGNDFSFADENECLKSMYDVKNAIDIAEKLGIKYLRIFAGFSPVAEVTGKRWNIMIKMLNEVLKYGNEHNVLPAIETHGGVEPYQDGIRHFHSTTTDTEKLFKLLEDLQYPVGIVFDPANLGAVGMNEDEIISIYQKLSSQVSYFHLKDFALTTTGALVPCACGEGKLDWNILWKEFKGAPCPGMMEYELTEDIERGLNNTLVYLKKL